MPPVTPQPRHLLGPETAVDKISTQYFCLLYIPLAGLINPMILANRPWAVLKQIFILDCEVSPILWWASHLCLGVVLPTCQKLLLVGSPILWYEPPVKQDFHFIMSYPKGQDL
ncbi:hypothetical protein DSO57_1012972 [Entomophthora muscae]|uniref:Uncharacterized protein n=1 Tax=Entomophthora muscae TaxID=34485 RepID=A0ACC2TGW3_9FUNG|nr:hypothetical protein DSO57_1012972 [Entomophthora muscae]